MYICNKVVTKLVIKVPFSTLPLGPVCYIMKSKGTAWWESLRLLVQTHCIMPDQISLNVWNSYSILNTG